MQIIKTEIEFNPNGEMETAAKELGMKILRELRPFMDGKNINTAAFNLIYILGIAADYALFLFDKHATNFPNNQESLDILRMQLQSCLQQCAEHGKIKN